LSGKSGKRGAFWLRIMGLASFLVVFAQSAPVSCGTTPDAQGKRLLTICRSVTGIPYGGSSAADFLPALVFASTVAIPMALAARTALRRRGGVTSPQ
jgi:hypothetical protein